MMEAMTLQILDIPVIEATNLHRAAEEGLESLVAQILAAHTDAVKEADARGLTPLHCAAANGHDKIVELLLPSARDNQVVTAVDVSGWTALHFAADKGHCGVVAQLLAESPELVEAADACERTALHFAASNGHDKVVAQLLAQKRPMIGAVTSNGWTALHFAAAGGHENVVAQLLLAPESSAIIHSADLVGRTPLHWAARCGNSKVVALLLAAGSPYVIHAVDTHGFSVLYFAVDNGHDEVVSQLLAVLGSIPSDSPALHWAAHNGSEKIAAQLLATNEELIHAVDTHGRTVLHYAVMEGHENVARLFLRSKPALILAIDSSGDTTLHVAIKQRQCSETFITDLWRLHPDALRTSNHRSESPFQLAVKYSNERGIEALQWGLCFDEIVEIFSACKRPCMKRLWPVVESQCVCLLYVLHQDVLGTVFGYLGFDTSKKTANPTPSHANT